MFCDFNKVDSLSRGSIMLQKFQNIMMRYVLTFKVHLKKVQDHNKNWQLNMLV